MQKMGELCRVPERVSEGYYTQAEACRTKKFSLVHRGMKPFLIFSLSILFLIPCSRAQVRVVKSADRKITINFSALQTNADPAARTFFQTLEKDLRLSGWFDPRRSGGELSLTGTITGKGKKLKVICQIFRDSDQSRLFSKNYSIEIARARALAHRVADDIVEAITTHKGIASTKIAVVGSRSGNKELYLCDADGGGLTQLTRDGQIVVGPQWGPLGDSIVVTSFLRGFPDIYQLNLRKGRRDRLASYGGLNTGATLSPDGKELALILSKDGNPELYIQNVRNGHLRRLTNTRHANEASPSWSPDNRHLVYVSDQGGTPQLYLISCEGGRPQRLSNRGRENVAPDWGPNGLITCASRSGGHYVIAIIQPTTGQTTYLSTDGADYEDPSWAPDGRHIVAARSVNYQSSLYLLDTISDPPVALLQGHGDWISPDWSPR